MVLLDLKTCFTGPLHCITTLYISRPKPVKDNFMRNTSHHLFIFKGRDQSIFCIGNGVSWEVCGYSRRALRLCVFEKRGVIINLSHVFSMCQGQKKKDIQPLTCHKKKESYSLQVNCQHQFTYEKQRPLTDVNMGLIVIQLQVFLTESLT